jgi:hypothetical protein
VGALGNDEVSGVIPSYHRATPRPEALPTASAFYQRVHEAELKIQNYDKGFDKFTRKFNPTEEMTATVAVTLGYQDDHGWAVHRTQGSRRCLLLDTVDGFTDDEALWTGWSAWASFQPRKANRRRIPGDLFARPKRPTFSRNTGTTCYVSRHCMAVTRIAGSPRRGMDSGRM